MTDVVNAEAPYLAAELLPALCLCTAAYVDSTRADILAGRVYCRRCQPPPPMVCPLCASPHHALECSLSVGLRRRPRRGRT